MLLYIYYKSVYGKQYYNTIAMLTHHQPYLVTSFYNSQNTSFFNSSLFIICFYPPTQMEYNCIGYELKFL